VMPESREIERAMREITSQHDVEKIVVACRAYFDQIYEQGL
jgi:hypothetical protein